MEIKVSPLDPGRENLTTRSRINYLSLLKSGHSNTTNVMYVDTRPPRKESVRLDKLGGIVPAHQVILEVPVVSVYYSSLQRDAVTLLVL